MPYVVLFFNVKYVCLMVIRLIAMLLFFSSWSKDDQDKSVEIVSNVSLRQTLPFFIRTFCIIILTTRNQDV